MSQPNDHNGNSFPCCNWKVGRGGGQTHRKTKMLLFALIRRMLCNMSMLHKVKLLTNISI